MIVFQPTITNHIPVIVLVLPEINGDIEKVQSQMSVGPVVGALNHLAV